MSSYVVYHLHTDFSNCNGYADSCTNYKDYIKLAKQQGHSAIAFSEHGGTYEWIRKKQDCDKAGLKYIHGVELYLCTKFEHDERGGHIGLYARNWDGVKELNTLLSLSTLKGKNEDKTDRHFYYHPRISIEELMNTSSNIIITSACLASILWTKRNEECAIHLLQWMSTHNDRCFLEIQYHNHPDQIEYNRMLYQWSLDYKIPLIAGTDTHSSNTYKAECRKILQKSKQSYYGDEDAFDLTWKTYDELINVFNIQNSLPMDVVKEAVNNTNVLASMVEDFKLDKSFKYPNLYGDNAIYEWKKMINKKYSEKIKGGIIDKNKSKQYINAIKEEFEVMKKQGMESFMMFMSELVDYCMDNNIPYGFCRGSVGGSLVAFITDITDVDPIVWKTVFSRFCNADRISLGDIDCDFAPEDRKKVYEYIIKRLTPEKTAYIAQFGTLKDRGTIDTLARGLEYKNLDIVKNIKNQFESLFNDYFKIIQEEVNLEELEPVEARSVDFDYIEIYKKQIRNTDAINTIENLKYKFDKLKLDNKDIFYYFDGLKGTIISKGSHPSGIIGSPITLIDNLGVTYKDGDENIPVSTCAMKAVDSLNYTKFDILGLKTVGIIKDTYSYIGSHYLKAYEINWQDENVWSNMITSPVGVFQFEGDYAFSLLKDFKPHYINDMSLVNAALRPSGKSYRDRLIKREFNKNPSDQIDELLAENYGYLVFQEDTIKFLTDICGFDGATADTTRRAIGKKDLALLNEQLPKILEGYCAKSPQPRKIAEQEAKQFLQIIDDSSEYQFGLNHSNGYSMNGYACTRLRTYYPLEFITAYLNRAETEDDILAGTQLAKEKNININPIKFRYSRDIYWFDKQTNSIYKGISSIKGFGEKGCVGEELYKLKDEKYNHFIDILDDIQSKTSVGDAKIEILIKLSYFSEFGSNKQLFDFFQMYKAIHGKSQIKKDKANTLNIAELIKQCCRETEKTYMDVDSKKLLTLIWDITPHTQFTIKEQLQFEHICYGYLESTFKTSNKWAIVTNIDTKYTPKITVYYLQSGISVMYKLNKKSYSDHKFEEWDIIQIETTEDKNKSKKVDDKWIKLDETEPWIKNYYIVKGDENHVELL